MKKSISTSLFAVIMLVTFTVRAASGLDDFYTYMANTVKYIDQARTKNLQGNSIVLFTLKNGSLSNLKINTELGEGTDVEVLNNLMAYPNFKSLKDGKYALTTCFRLTGSTTSIVNENAKGPEGYTALKLTIVGEIPKITIATREGKSSKTILVNDVGHNMVFRGTTQDPKVLIDSVQIDYDDLKNVIPDRIQSIHIYRGVDAVANYGPDAVNGVIVVVTKKEKPVLPLKKEAPVKQN